MKPFYLRDSIQSVKRLQEGMEDAHCRTAEVSGSFQMYAEEILNCHDWKLCFHSAASLGVLDVIQNFVER